MLPSLDKIRRSVLAGLILALCTPALCLRAGAQDIATKISFSGAAPYTDTDLTSIIGIHSGQLFTDEDLQAASQRLTDTGLFDTATVTATGDPQSREAIFGLKITALDKLLPPSFENIVWFTPEELETELRARVPLYRGLLPETGKINDAVADAIAAMLKEKGVPASVFHSILEPTTEHPVRAVNFEMGNISVRIGKVRLSVTGPAGAPEQLAPAIEDTLLRVTGSAYNEGLGGITLTDRLLAPVREAGYIAATLDVGNRSPVQDESGYTVSCNAKIETGDAYTVGSIIWEPTPVYPAADFARNTKVHPGDIASSTALAATIDPILTAYRQRGYMEAYVRITPTLQSSTRTVNYALSIVGGSPYRLNNLTALGLTPAQQKSFEASFAIKQGDPYSEPYVSNFLHNNASLHDFQGLIATFEATANPNTHLVDLVITFAPNGGEQ